MEFADRVKSTTATTGTGNITVSGTPALRHQPFSDLTVGKQYAIVIEGRDTSAEFEESVCTVLSATSFSRDTVLKSSNGGAKVDFTAGTKDVFVTASADQLNKLASIETGVTFSNVIPLSKPGTVIMADKPVTAKITFTASTVAAPGAVVYAALIADGVTANAPDVSAFAKDNGSSDYVNTAGVRNRFTFWSDGVDKIYSVSQNVAAAAVPATPTVTSVTVSPSTAAVAGGATQTYTATVTGTNSPAQTVTWTASAGTITSGGVFTAPASTASAQTITITATSTFDTSKSGTATATVAATGTPAPTVSSVTVTPSTANVAGGATQQYSAAVAGTNSPGQGVTWTTNLGTINSAGLYTAPAATSSAQTATITATSTVDNTKSGTATATIAAAAPTGVERFSVRSNITESASAPYTYTGTGGSYSTQHATLNKTRQSGTNATFAIKVNNGASNGTLLGMHNNPTPVAFTSMELYFFASTNASGVGTTYSAGRYGGTNGAGYTGGTSTNYMAGDIMRLRAEGTTVFAEVARASSPTTFIIIGQWANITTDVIYFQLGMATSPTVSELTSTGLL